MGNALQLAPSRLASALAIGAVAAAVNPTTASDWRPAPAMTPAADQTSAEPLQHTLYDLFALRQLAHQVAYNVAGPGAYEAQRMANSLVGELSEPIHRTARRLRALGVAVDARPSAIAMSDFSTESEPVLSSAAEQLLALRDAYTIVAQNLRTRMDDSVDDPVTQSLLAAVALSVEDALGLLSARLIEQLPTKP